MSKEKDFALKILWSMFMWVAREDGLMKGKRNKTLQDGLERGKAEREAETMVKQETWNNEG